MKISGLTNIFVKEIEGKNGKFKAFTTTISHKNEDGTFKNAHMNVRFAKGLEKGVVTLKPDYYYSVDVTDAWLDVRTYPDATGKEQREIFIFINSALVKSQAKVKKENELPNLSK